MTRRSAIRGAPAGGELAHPLVLEAPARTLDAGGGALVSWTAHATVWAAIRAVSGRDGVVADAVSSTVSHEIWIRYRPGVVAAQRFRAGERVFHIVAVIDAGEARTWLRCLAEERRQ